MSNNIVSFEVSKSPNTYSISNVSAGKNIININLNQSQSLVQSDTVSGYDDNINFSETGIQEYTLEELLAEGAQTQADIQQKRAEEEARRLAEEQARREAEMREALEATLASHHDRMKGILAGGTTEDELKYYRDRFCQGILVTCASAGTGIIDFGEDIVDGGTQLLGGAIADVTEYFDPDLADLMREEIEAQVSYDTSEVLYSEYLSWCEDCGIKIDEDIAYGPLHTGGEFFSKLVCSLAIAKGTSNATQTNKIPSKESKTIMGLMMGLSSSGDSTETAYKNNATFEEANTVSRTNFAIGTVTGILMDKLQIDALGSTTAKEVAKYFGLGTLLGSSEPFANSIIEYNTYGKKNSESYLDYMNDTGGWWSVAFGGLFGGINAGTNAYTGYKNSKTAIDMSTNKPIVTDVIESKKAFFENPDMTDKIIKANEINYSRNKSNFISEQAYYEAQEYVAKNNYWDVDSNGKPVHKVLSPDDPGLTACYTEEFKIEWNNTIDSHTVDGITKTNNFNTTPEIFVEKVLGQKGDAYGTFGYEGNYNFGCPGTIDESLENIKPVSGENFINTFQTNRGVDVSNSKRIIFTEVDVPRDTITMHSGKELGSSIQRMPGALPDGSVELVYETIEIDDTIANSTKVKIMSDDGTVLFDDTLDALKNLQSTNSSEFNRIMGIIPE